MTRYIDTDALKEFIESAYRPLCDDYHMKDYVLNQILTDIKNAPTVDAVEVIRCKDCVFWEEYCRVVDGVRTDHVCSKKRELDGLMHRTKADDFCSWAERKEECGQRSAD